MRLSFFSALLVLATVLGGADGCSSDPNIETAKLDIRNKQYDSALENLDEALEADPDNATALRLKAQVLATKMEAIPAGRIAERAALIPALQDAIQNATRVSPEDEEVAQVRVFSWATMLNTGNASLQDVSTPSSDAIPFFEGAIAVQPDSVGGHFGLGLARLLSDEYAMAATSLERTVEMSPMNANAYIYLSKAYLRLDRGADAVDILAQARGVIPETDEARAELDQEYLNTLASSGQTDRAIAEFEGQVENFPNDPLIRYNYGTLLLGVDRFADAIEQFELATTLETDNADALYNLGVARLREAGRIETEAGTLELNQQEEYDRMIAERDVLVEGSLEALVAARDLAEAGTRPTVCRTLVTIYNSLGRAEEAEAAAECAGESMN